MMEEVKDIDRKLIVPAKLAKDALKPMKKAIKKREDAKVGKTCYEVSTAADASLTGRLRAVQEPLRGPPEQEVAIRPRECRPEQARGRSRALHTRLSARRREPARPPPQAQRSHLLTPPTPPRQPDRAAEQPHRESLHSATPVLARARVPGPTARARRSDTPVGLEFHIATQRDGTGIYAAQDRQSSPAAHAPTRQGRNHDRTGHTQQSHARPADKQQRCSTHHHTHKHTAVAKSVEHKRERPTAQSLHQTVLQFSQRIETTHTVQLTPSHAQHRGLRSTDLNSVA